MTNKIVDFVLNKFGASTEGPPLGLDPKYVGTWNKFKVDGTPRFESLLNFFHLTKVAGLKAFSQKIAYGKYLEDAIVEEISPLAKILSRAMLKARLLEAFVIRKADIKVDVGNSTTIITINLLMKPRITRDTMDQALGRLKGSLYQKELPVALQQKYKYKSINARAKSGLPDYRHFFNSSHLLGRFIYVASNNIVVAFAAARDDCLVMTSVLTIPTFNVDFLPTRKYKAFVANKVKNAWTHR